MRKLFNFFNKQEKAAKTIEDELKTLQEVTLVANQPDGWYIQGRRRNTSRRNWKNNKRAGFHK